MLRREEERVREENTRIYPEFSSRGALVPMALLGEGSVWSVESHVAGNRYLSSNHLNAVYKSLEQVPAGTCFTLGILVLTFSHIKTTN
jgi:hypothetical protein